MGQNREKLGGNPQGRRSNRPGKLSGKRTFFDHKLWRVTRASAEGITISGACKGKDRGGIERDGAQALSYGFGAGDPARWRDNHVQP